MKISISQIQNIVSNATNISVELINSPSRKANIVQARHLSMHFSRWNTELPMLKIAKLHNRDNHATIIHADTCISNDIRKNVRLKEIYNEIESQIKNF
jgi:chromosomal replication initiator protein